jgi:hypothetical protein
MDKLDSVIYNKLLIQAHEAKDQGSIKLAEAVFKAIGPEPRDESTEYSYAELKNDIHSDLWKIATRLIMYYDLNSADVSKLDKTIIHWASRTLNELENTLEVDGVIKGPLEPNIPGEIK